MSENPDMGHRLDWGVDIPAMWANCPPAHTSSHPSSDIAPPPLGRATAVGNEQLVFLLVVGVLHRYPLNLEGVMVCHFNDLRAIVIGHDHKARYAGTSISCSSIA